MSILIAILALGLTAPAFAEKPEFSGQVQSVRLYNTPKTPKPDLLKENTKPESEMDAADRVWEKYKELAMGVNNDPKEETDKSEKTEKEDDKKESKTAEAKDKKPAPTGMQSMIQAYQKNKEQRSQMQSMSFNGSKKAQE